MLRTEEPPDDLLVVVRASPADRLLAAAEIAADAAESARVYVIPDEGRQVILHGVSVFAHRAGVDVAYVLNRFPFAPAYAAVTVGRLREAGFAVLPTGANPDHFDVQLVAGRAAGDGPAERSALTAAAVRMLQVAGELRPNPAYAVGEESR